MFSIYVKKDSEYVFVKVHHQHKSGLILDTIKSTFFYNTKQNNYISDIRIVFFQIDEKYIEMKYFFEYYQFIIKVCDPTFFDTFMFKNIENIQKQKK